nr:immunoglobulin light chain junction region [Macaca mulatta]MOY09439.1 immunoglobulin light chain junction region [Macaca mulatta]MOY10100.1 immunoglobulin light chain junction region [Macaca mulatta]
DYFCQVWDINNNHPHMLF